MRIMRWYRQRRRQQRLRALQRELFKVEARWQAVKTVSEMSGRIGITECENLLERRTVLVHDIADLEAQQREAS